MSQKRIQDYGSPIVAQSLKSLTYAITTPGILDGNEFIRDASDRVRINPGSCVTHQGVIIVESEAKVFTLSTSSTMPHNPTDYTIYYSHEDVDISGGVTAELILAPSLLTTTEVKGCILGYIRYPGNGVALEQSHFIQPPPLKIGLVTPTAENSPWLIPLKGQGYIVSPGTTLTITDGGIETFTPIAITGSLTSGSNIVTSVLPSTISLLVGMVVTGTNIPSGTVITSVDPTSQITLNNAVTGTATTTLSAQAPQPVLYMKIRNNTLATGTATLTFPFKVGENPFALLQIIIGTDINATVSASFIDSTGEPISLGTGFTGQQEFRLNSVTIPRTTVQTPNTIVYLRLQVLLSSLKEARIQSIGLNTYNLPF